MLLSNRALYSDDMAIFQFGSWRAVRWDLGKGEMVVLCSVFSDIGIRGLEMPDRERVCMGCEGGGGERGCGVGWGGGAGTGDRSGCWGGVVGGVGDGGKLVSKKVGEVSRKV